MYWVYCKENSSLDTASPCPPNYITLCLETQCLEAVIISTNLVVQVLRLSSQYWVCFFSSVFCDKMKPYPRINSAVQVTIGIRSWDLSNNNIKCWVAENLHLILIVPKYFKWQHYRVKYSLDWVLRDCIFVVVISVIRGRFWLIWTMWLFIIDTREYKRLWLCSSRHRKQFNKRNK